ncbi:transmembrane domain-containing protein, partial [Eschrichtius robustus]|nr:transmembrane domain-containing protein [Eschrichtius robustus]
RFGAGRQLGEAYCEVYGSLAANRELAVCARAAWPGLSSKVKYSRLSSTDDGYIDLQFKKSPPKIPYKAIALATVLFLIGAFLIIIGSLLLAGYISKGVS